MSVVQVDRVETNAVNSILFDNHQKNERPLLITGGCKDWLAFKKWNLRFFEDIGKSTKVSVSQYRTLGHQSPNERKRINLAQLMSSYRNYIEGKQTSFSDIYLAGWHYLQDFPDLIDDINIPDIFSDNLLPAISDEVFNYDWSSIFIGHKNVETPCHTDSFYVAVWLALIKGRKTFRYVSSKYHNKVYSGMDLFSLEIEEDFHQNGITIYESSVEEGDIIYHPPGWWHQVKNHNFSIAVSNNYLNKRNYLPFEQQLISKTVIPIITKLFQFKSANGVLKALQELPKDELKQLQSIQSSNYIDNQRIINDVFKNYLTYFDNLNRHLK